MKTPVLIPAFQEASRLAETLHHLPSDKVDPLVVANGCTDDTEDVARAFGCDVIALAEQGKMPAIQAALLHLGKRATDPLIILDADTYPRFPKRWHDAMVNPLQSGKVDRPAAVGGPVWFTEAAFGLCALKTADRIVRAAIVRSNSTPETCLTPGIRRMSQLGPNMGVRLANQATLDAILGLPNYWPGEDKAIAYTILQQSGVLHQLINPLSIAVTPASESFPSLRETMRLGIRSTRQRMAQLYIERNIPGSTPFDTTPPNRQE